MKLNSIERLVVNNPLRRAGQFLEMQWFSRRLSVSQGARVLEIGCGWGGFAQYAAEQGYRVTGITLSNEQLVFARNRIHNAGLDSLVELHFKDYRELSPDHPYDHIVSIEMFEAVGMEYWETYFSAIKKLLKPSGRALLQVITIDEGMFADYKDNPGGFIQRYIFPGGSLPSVKVIADNVARHTDMRCFHLEEIGAHYATTLANWRERFFSSLAHIQELGYSETFIRMWNFYLCYCEGGFRENTIGTIQLLLTKPMCQREPLLNIDTAGR